MSPRVSILFILNLLFLFGNVVGSLNPRFQACEPKTCGNGQNITFPFHIKGKQDPSCGLPHFGLVCASNGFPVLNLSNTFYIVDEIFSNPSFQLSNSTNCFSPSTNLTTSIRFTLAPNQKEVLLFFGCDLPSLAEEMKANVLGCFEGNRTRWVLGMAVNDEEKKLKYAKDNCRDGSTMRMVVENVEGGIREALRRGFLLKQRNWTVRGCDACQSSGGRCGFDFDANGFRCFCRNSDQLARCSSGGLLSVRIQSD
ncbi:LEAF RUST 10 DISEASE-RESISTANCE LOCUS RECEPTOR-LIKE PROTEIN KINASE-like 1.2 [Neltuma alba]|uniref:LEAF RUST 10 DISEASE-RESISTANCE LOCUS RECEPTOR-LIKE PROTEIN KINASE-like 1.2 n=1 Tax=Neltuma alba TaxID=207710 RepID=UPI0010A2E478|nr:LEAF RUST 10 DISEASE-RESISTANCE LOCUS RECEPTOR-LIKE PROTEIN KINASE-like 1.2 [Prosopis alba]